MNLSEVLEMILRSTGAFFVLLLMTRIMGKKQISQLTFFHYATGITIGNIAASISSDPDTPFWSGLASLIWWALLTMAMAYLTLKWAGARKIIDGQPTIVIKKGILQQNALKRAGLKLDNVNMLLRQQSVFSIRDVDYAILEPNGKMSVLLTQDQQTPTRKDFKLPKNPSSYIPSEIIVDGRIVQQNLTELGLNDTWLKKELKGIPSNEVLYAEIQSDGSLYYQRKHHSPE